MKIGIDVFGCEHGKSGTGSYIYSLIKNLPEIENCEYELFGHEIDRYTFDLGNGKSSFTGIEVADTNSAESLWHKIYFNTFIAKQKYDIVFIPSDIIQTTFKTKIPLVFLAHNKISSKINDKTTKKSTKIFLKNLRKASAIIAMSQNIKKDLQSFKIDSKKIEVIYAGVEHNSSLNIEDFYDAEEDLALIKPFAIKRPYITYASRLTDKNKKHIELIDAFCEFKESTNLPHRLVLAGNTDKYTDKIKAKIRKSKYASDIIITGHFPQEDFVKLYSLSDACIFPAIKEIVGLSVLEAMACGIPVACAKQSLISDLTGGLALDFDIEKSKDFSKAIEEIITNNALREKLKKDGLEWTKRFSWDKTAQKTVEYLIATQKK